MEKLGSIRNMAQMSASGLQPLMPAEGDVAWQDLAAAGR